MTAFLNQGISQSKKGLLHPSFTTLNKCRSYAKSCSIIKKVLKKPRPKIIKLILPGH